MWGPASMCLCVRHGRLYMCEKGKVCAQVHAHGSVGGLPVEEGCRTLMGRGGGREAGGERKGQGKVTNLPEQEGRGA